MIEHFNIRERTENEIEKLETNLFTFENRDARPEAKRVLLTTQDPGSFNVVKPVLAALTHDARCGGGLAITSGVAVQNLRREFPGLDHVRGNGSVFEDIGHITAKRPIDIALTTISSRNGPETPLLFAGKETFGVKKTFLLIDGWGTLGGIFAAGNKERMEHIDGIFCMDELEKVLVEASLPDYPADRIFPFGSPATEQLELEKGAEYRRATRERLGIGENAFVILYAGDLASDYEKNSGVSPNFNVDTFEKTKKAIAAWAVVHPDREVTLIVRPHPRAKDTSDWNRLVSAAAEPTTQKNFSIKNGSPDNCTMNEAAYAGDVVVSIESTENFYAPMRGRSSIFLGYSDLQLDSKMLEPRFPGGAFDTLKKMSGMTLVTSEQALLETLDRISAEPLPEPVIVPTSTNKILDTLFRS